MSDTAAPTVGSAAPCSPEFGPGDLVKYRPGKGVLCCGCGSYPRAVVVSLSPFILISEAGDMRWKATIEIADFEKDGEADRAALLAVIDRLKREQFPETPTSRTTHPRRLIL